MHEQVTHWLSRDPDPATRAEIAALVQQSNHQELALRFSGRLQFGTAGLRGVMGAGESRMNRLVVQESTAGLGAYLLASLADAKERGVVLGYDGRRLSDVFARDAAEVLMGLGIRVHLFDQVASTPVAAFAVTHLGAAAGIVITASHNPPEYNGYKVYWQNGAQIIPPHDMGIAEAINAATLRPLPWQSLEQGRSCGLLQTLSDEMFATYRHHAVRLCIHGENAQRQDIVIAYTPLHGVGAETVEKALAAAGFSNVHTVASQRQPDGAFPTVRFPNPEEPGAMDAVIALGGEVGADLVLANDPDADRLAVALPTEGGYQMLTGNEIGVLLGFSQLQDNATNAMVATTIVSSRMLGVIAQDLGAEYFETLTGFKWIANGALQRERQSPGKRFVFGYEEALGYTIGDLVRDKDGISAILAFAELAASLRAKGQSVLGQLEQLYQRYGIYNTAQKSIATNPLQVNDLNLGDKLRRSPPEAIGAVALAFTTDLKLGVRQDKAGAARPVNLPASDVLIYELEDSSRVIVRPSGTEPKVKCYYEVVTHMLPNESFAAAQARSKQALEQLMDAHQQAIAALA